MAATPTICVVLNPRNGDKQFNKNAGHKPQWVWQSGIPGFWRNTGRSGYRDPWNRQTQRQAPTQTEGRDAPLYTGI